MQNYCFFCIYANFLVLLWRNSEKIVIMKKYCIVFLAILVSSSVVAQKQNPTYLEYIDQWKATAIQQQEEFGIPAAITMAQALLESAAGQSELAMNANNHFGIKCAGDWFGGVYYYDDDSKGECFRQYYDAAESFKDHSRFLQRPRYATCFEIAIEDYEGWAYRLRECGYATDKQYAPKLIKIIEDYRLDTLALGVKAGEFNPNAEQELREREPSVTKRPLKAAIVHRSEPIMVIHNDPEPEYVEPLTAREERDSFFLEHPKKRHNGLVYVLARENDTYANVAFRLNVRERDLREDNDALGRDLQVGDRIYLSAKKSNGEQPFVWTHPGLSLWKLSQDEGVTIASIRKWNELLDPSIRVFRTRQKIYLRKVKEDAQR